MKKVKSKEKTKLTLLGFVAIFALAIILCVSTALLVRRIKLQNTLIHIENLYPSLVVERLYFSKYLIQTSFDSSNDYFSSLDVFLIKGEAEIKIDMGGVSINKSASDFIDKVLVLDYFGKDDFITSIEVFIAPENVFFVESISPKEISFGFKSRFFGESGVFLFANKAVALVQKSLTQTPSVVETLRAAKPVIASEILGENIESRVEKELYYRKRFESKINSLAKEFGWNNVVINYGVGLENLGGGNL